MPPSALGKQYYLRTTTCRGMPRYGGLLVMKQSESRPNKSCSRSDTGRPSMAFASERGRRRHGKPGRRSQERNPTKLRDLATAGLDSDRKLLGSTVSAGKMGQGVYCD